ncbi:MAG TPA: nuclear transport factor 2 family protein [Caulobacterales bacterium]|nr:nuclear transport factor 2 family protein [Caulobacterales bacterium]
MRAFLLGLTALALAACSRPPEAAPATPPEVQRLVDEAEIVKLAASLDDAVDRKDWAAARACFEDEVDVDFSSLGGTPSRITATGLVGNWQTALTPEKQSFHLRGDPVVTIAGDAATMVSHGYAWNKLTTAKGEPLWEVWGVYEHRFARSPQGWRISGMKFVKTHERGDPSVRGGSG